jgi:hypothetical protein
MSFCSCLRPPCFERSAPSPTAGSSELDAAKEEGKKDLRNLIITTVALIAVAVFLIALSRLGTGLGHLPATRMTGFSFIYHFAAMHIFFIGAGMGLVALGFALASAWQARSNVIKEDGLAARAALNLSDASEIED